MKKLNNPQIWLLIITLIAGAAYLLYKPQGALMPGLAPELTPSNSRSIPETSSFTPVQTASTKPTSSLAINTWQTDNKVPVYFVAANELPMVDIEVTFKAGAAYNPAQPGVASMTSSMLLEGTKKYNTEQISEQIENIGAELSAGAGKDNASINLRSLSEQDILNKSLEIMTDIITNASFPEKSFTRIKKQTIESLKLEDQYPENIIRKTFYQDIYNNHPYGLPTDGTIDSVEKITVNNLKDFFNKYYVSSNAMITIVGDLSIEKAKQVSNQISQAIKPSTEVFSLPAVNKLNTGLKEHIDFPSTQTHIIIGSVGIKRNDPDYFPLIVGNHILGSLPLTSKLFKNVRVERGLAYSVYSTFSPMLDAGPFYINMQTRNEKAKEALDVSLETLKNFMLTGPSEEELTMAKENLTGSFSLGIASNSKKLGVVSTIGFYNLPLDYLDTYISNVNNVSAEDIKQAFSKHIDLDKLAIITVGEKNSPNQAS